MKVKMEEVKATRLVIVVNTLGVFGRDSDEVSSSSSTSTSPPTPCAKVGLLQLSIEHLLFSGKVKEERRHRCYPFLSWPMLMLATNIRYVLHIFSS